MTHFKKIFFAFVLLFSVLLVAGQTRDVSVMIDNENRNAVAITIDQPEKMTSGALRQRMERSGLKEREKNGVVRYKGVTLSEISTSMVDIYTKVEKGPNNSSVVYMAVSRGYNNFTATAADSNITQNVKLFLQSFVKDANNYSADIGISNQINDVNKGEKSYQKLLDEQRDLRKKKENIEKRLLEIDGELSTKETELDRKKSGVEDAKNKRSNINN